MSFSAEALEIKSQAIVWFLSEELTSKKWIPENSEI